MASCQNIASLNPWPSVLINTPTLNVITKIITISPDLTPSPTVECILPPTGMNVDVKPINHTWARVNLSGFPPDDKITLIFTTSHENTMNRFGSGPGLVTQDGTYTSLENLFIEPDREKIHWHVQVLFSQGSICKEIDMP